MTGGEQRHDVHAAIDAPVAGSSVAAGLLRVSGWAFDTDALLDAALVVVDGGPPVAARLGILRPDVREYFGDRPDHDTPGFEASVDLRSVRAGGAPTRISLLVRTADGAWHDAAQTDVVVTPAARPRDGARARAAFTIVHDEPVMLPIWLRHYGRSFAPEDLFVLTHDRPSDADLARAGGANVVPVHREASFDHLWLKSTVERFQAFLLRSYDTVLFAEVDEMLVADPLRHADLGAYLDVFTGPAVRCAGFNVVQQPDEAPIRWDEPLLAQRRWWHASLKYSKRLVTRVPLAWTDGFHRELALPDAAPDPGLLLVHLHRIDLDACLERHRRSAARDWNADDLHSGAGVQNRIADPAAVERWFWDEDELEGPGELIPEHLRSAL